MAAKLTHDLYPERKTIAVVTVAATTAEVVAEGAVDVGADPAEVRYRLPCLGVKASA